MQKDRFVHLCMEAESGRDAFVRHPGDGEEGMITGCDLQGGRMLIQTSDAQTRLWDFNECDDLIRPKLGPMA